MNAADADEHLRESQVLEPVEQRGHRRRCRHDRRRRDTEGAFHEDVPHRPEPGDGERDAEHLDPLALPDHRQEECEQEERHLDHQPPEDEGERDAPDEGQRDQDQRVQAERPERLTGRRHDREDEQDRRRELALWRQPVER